MFEPKVNIICAFSILMISNVFNIDSESRLGVLQALTFQTKDKVTQTAGVSGKKNNRYLPASRYAGRLFIYIACSCFKIGC